MVDTETTMEGVARAKPVPEARTSAVASLAENLAGGGAIALSIIGLAGIAPRFVAAIAVIAVGAALLFEGGAIASRLRRILREKSRAGIDAAEFGGGISTEFFGGAAGLVLGILAIVDVVPIHLIPIAIVVFGASILRGSRTVARMNAQLVENLEESPEAKSVANELISSSEGVQVLIGLAAFTLGIIAVIGIEPLVLSLVALLIIGFSNLVGGKAVNEKILSVSSVKT
jgi:hypothetical protein